MKYLFFLLLLTACGRGHCQLLDMELECPVIYSAAGFASAGIDHLTIIQTGGNVKRDLKKHSSAAMTYYFDSAGQPYMKVLHDKGDYTDSFMMNSKRCEYKTEADSRFYEENIFCNDHGLILANQTEKSRIFYRYDSAYRLIEWIQIDREIDEESQVFLTKYQYDSIGRPDSIIEKEGALRFNLSTRQLDTIYRSAVFRKVKYKDDHVNSILNYTGNNLGQIVPLSVYRYKYKGDKLDMIELSPAEDKKVSYTLKVLWQD